jgi:photosystem II stability/assembly factor-like uncharacterized protein
MSHPAAKVGPEIPVSWSLSGRNWEAVEAVDPVHHYIYALWIGWQGIGFSRSTDGGASFQPAIFLPGSDDIFNNTSYSTSWDPAIVTSANGTIYAAYMYYNTSRLPGKLPRVDAPVVAVSYNFGRSFAFHSIVNHTSGLSSNDREYLAVAPSGDVYVTWDYSPNGSLDSYKCYLGSCSFAAGDYNAVFTRSTDGGHTWSRIVAVSPGYPYGGAIAAPLLVEPNGRIDVLYNAHHTNLTTLKLTGGLEYFTTSTDRGRTWSTPVVVGNPAYITRDVNKWIDGSLALGAGGVLFVTYDSQRPYGDIGWLLYSTDHGRTWSTPIRATPGTTGADHIIQVTAGPQGQAYVGWIANDSKRGWSAYVAVFSFAHSHPQLSSPIRVNSYYGSLALWEGDTIGLVYLGDQHVSMAWAVGVITGTFQRESIQNVVVNFDP